MKNAEIIAKAITDPENPGVGLIKRKWVYVQPPSAYEIAPCGCGSADTQWSEYAGHLWCEKCQKDFIPAHSGIFDGPIPVNACLLMGISLDRLNLETQQVEIFENRCGVSACLDEQEVDAIPESE